jgi:hypothetical protein
MTTLKSVVRAQSTGSRRSFGCGVSRFIVPCVTLAMVAAATLPSSARAGAIDPGDLVLKYDSLNGNLSLLFTGTGAAGAGPLALQELNILTLGNGFAGSAMPSGIPNVTAGEGGLNGARATLPSASFQTFNTGSNSDGVNGVFSQIYNANVGSTWFTFSKTTPGVSDTLNLGNVAASGWTQSIANTIFITDPDLYDTELNPGYFGYTTGASDLRVGQVQVVNAVPEPGSMALLASGAIGAGAWYRTRRRGRRPSA